MKKTFFIILPVLLVIFAMSFFVVEKFPGLAGKKNPEPVGDESLTVLQIKAEAKKYTESSAEYNYEVVAEYPEFSGIGGRDTQNVIDPDGLLGTK